MNRPKNAPLLAALAVAAAALSAAATWSLWDWSRDLSAETRAPSGSPR